MTTIATNATLSKAIFIATTAHRDQFDKGDHPYILHPLAVMYSMRTHGYDIETQCIAVLHDVMEDHPEWTEDKLLEAGMTQEIIDGLLLMRHNAGVDYFDYIEGMRHNIRALRVKLGDLEQNSDIRRLKGLRSKDFDRLQKYAKAYKLVQALIANYTTVEQFKQDHLRR